MKKYFLSRKPWFFLGFLLSLFAIAFNLFAQHLKGSVLDTAISGSLFLLRRNIILLLFAFVMSALFSIMNNYLRNRITRSMMKDLRRDFFHSLFRRPLLSFQELNEGDILAKYTKQLSTIEYEFITMGLMFIEYTIIIVAVIISMSFINPYLTVLSFIALLTPMITTKAFEKKLSLGEKSYLERYQRHHSKVQGYLKGIEAIKNYGIEDKIIKTFQLSNKQLQQEDSHRQHIRANSIGASFFTSLSAQIFIAIVSAVLVFNDYLTSGEFITIIALVGVLKVPVYWIAKLYQSVIATGPARASILSFIAEAPRPKDQGENNRDHNFRIRYRDIAFSYGDKTLLSSLNLDFKENGNYLITGESGSGKSTITNLLLGYLKADHGQLTIGETSIDEIRDPMTFITVSRQEAMIFRGSVKNNLTLFEDTVDDSELISILSQVGLEKLATSKGLHYAIEEGGSNLSGGEKKRLSLARAILRKTPILILDEPLANIDPANIDRIENLILNLKECTTIIISHHFNEDKLKFFDGIYHLEGGKAHEISVE
ncbi:MAG: ABC transporter ATP-binding protein [Tissierellia bacterium]|nr:ABC transporter ATP-binding protein [Tissierellia bacterium]